MNKTQRERLEQLAKQDMATMGDIGSYSSYCHGYAQCFEDAQVLVKALKAIKEHQVFGQEIDWEQWKEDKKRVWDALEKWESRE